VVNRLNNLMERVGRTLARERGFAMGAAHELRTPLAGLRARLELALSRPRSEEEYRAELKEALEIERGLESMVTHLLLLARLGQDGGGPFVTKPLNVGRLLRQSWGEFFDRAETRRLRVSIRVPEGVGELNTSEDLLALVIRNLFDNAVSYTPEEGKIDIVAHPARDGWELMVSNTNPGVREHDLPHLAEPFWRARHEEAAPDGRHAGLGLALCQRIASELGGTLTHSLVEPDLIRAHLILPAQPPVRSERGSGV
jgi:signal transduction histidine kinase